jgi:outer membrane biosynthesis protein TonB
MSTDTLPWFAQADIDSPWRRLHWTLPLALLICAAVFIWFAYSMGQPAIHTPEPVPIDAELVELPAPSQPQPQVRQKTIEQPKIEPAVQPEPNPPLQQEQPSENPAPIAPTPPPAVPVNTTIAPNNPSVLSENRGAQALVQPLPVIPDELRQDAMNEAATARFQIAVDGTATVELVKPTQNPRLNRLLLDKLKNWKFIPAIKEGKPVASVEVMVIRMQVK